MQKLASAMGRLDIKLLEVIHEFALAPWIDRLQMAEASDQEEELVKPDELDDIVIATSSSQRKGREKAQDASR
ncbi:hypothetical protein HIM_11738 [Hirsutella minnesotensis 3608]|uniref:Uncharacterized protein n=1 Tax=Hirsutella minnesotensis 3608 TaxID=1043627 RepID=A0A0F8A0V1_9HYPO|nr:hypothetical protein HIM_11738 [Hirsutella minnesotensis 3608]